MPRIIFALLAAAVAVGCGGGKKDTAKILTNEEFRKLECPSENIPPPGMEMAKATEEEEAQKEGEEPEQKPQLIAPGAQLTIFVEEDPSLNRQYIVPYRGWIEFPPLGRIQVVGLSGTELAAKIKAGLERDYFRRATVEVMIEYNVDKGSGIIYVLGQVGRAGPIAIPTDGSFTLTKAILAAGGGSTFANLEKVQIIRYCQDGSKYKTFVNVGRIMERGEFEDDVALRDGDWVLVPEKLINLW
ncbi:MAG: polysaccharide biosynthesis/export family protein [Verrucomicrobiae bacterium]|nr:polysaccharide biosynthesis/export family protein [Verrucomicrobiae bacterium]MDW8344485.1 polysaccharide biosynthesis/export family protein [Verrucomicrobiae bacterium]